MEFKSEDKIKLSPAQDSGDCGYHTIVIGLFYLALKATEDEKVARAINSSKSISSLLAEQPSLLQGALKKSFKTNHECLLSYLDSMDTVAFYKPSFDEILLNFTLQLKQVNAISNWLQDRIQNEIKSGLWLESNRQWDRLASFQHIMKKIQVKADELYKKETASKCGDLTSDLYAEIMFQAQIETCAALTPEDLALSAKEVVAHFYTSNAPKAWVDIEFLKCLVSDLLGSPEMMFDKHRLQITGEGASSDHWYIELPNDAHTKKFISIYNKGYQTGLSIVPSKANIEVTLSSCSSLFPPESTADTAFLESVAFDIC